MNRLSMTRRATGIAAALIAGDMAMAGCGAIADDSATASGDAPITIYMPTVDYAQAMGMRNRGAAKLRQRLDSMPFPLKWELMPVRRAFVQYQESKAACMLNAQGALREDEVTSPPLLVSHFWLYALEARGLPGVEAVRSIGTVSGAEKFVDLSAYPDVKWQFAPNYDTLVSMLGSGRVDAVTLGPRATDGTLVLPEGAVRLGDKPFLELVSVIRCKRSPQTVKFMEFLERNVAESGEVR